MNRLRRVVAFGLFVLFALWLVSWPTTRLFVAGLGESGVERWVILFATLCSVILLARLVTTGSVSGGDGQDSETSPGSTHTTHSLSASGPAQASSKTGNEGESTVERGDGWTGDRFLTGQGGTRNKGFQIEEQPPETDVDEHLQYLAEKLGEDVRDTGNDTTSGTGAQSPSDADIPEQCPQPYCDAVWAHSGLLSGSDGYEVLSDGTQVRCGSCGAIASLT
ncbi:hypothetical protein ACFQJ7_04145 [Halovenus rubra]|uniref:Uncharacterized protein n=2 Tax=Halovenus rubra TaxID=869890 RepID=A0ABD5X1X7_9EURY|nr:hypothetical protein [Halovenus rubra]